MTPRIPDNILTLLVTITGDILPPRDPNDDDDEDEEDEDEDEEDEDRHEEPAVVREPDE
jgi:hypothetical protein